MAHCHWPDSTLIPSLTLSTLCSCVDIRRGSRSPSKCLSEQLTTDRSDPIPSIRYTGSEMHLQSRFLHSLMHPKYISVGGHTTCCTFNRCITRYQLLLMLVEDICYTNTCGIIEHKCTIEPQKLLQHKLLIHLNSSHG